MSIINKSIVDASNITRLPIMCQEYVYKLEFLSLPSSARLVQDFQVKPVIYPMSSAPLEWTLGLVTNVRLGRMFFPKDKSYSFVKCKDKINNIEARNTNLA